MELIWIIVIAEWVMCGGALIWYYIQDRNKSMFIYFDTENTARIIKKDARDGSVVVPEGQVKKTYILDKTKPKLVKTFFGWKPTYFISWNKPLPMEVDVTEGKMNKSSISPENLTNMLEMKSIDKLLNPKQDKLNILMLIALGVVLGMMAGILVAKYMIK